MNDLDFRVRDGLMERGGVIGRTAYLRNMLIILGLSLVVSYLLGRFPDPVQGGGIGAAGLGFYLFMAYLNLINSFKRLRDIRGTTDKQLLYQVGIAILLFIPIVSFITLIYLLFAKGAITDKSRPVGTIEVIPRESDYQNRDYQRVPPMEEETRDRTA